MKIVLLVMLLLFVLTALPEKKTLGEMQAYYREKALTDVCAEARPYCYRPQTEPFMMTSLNCGSRIPTIAKPYCPMP